MKECSLFEKILGTGHCGVLVPDSVNKKDFIERLFSDKSVVEGLEDFHGLSGLVFSTAAIEQQMLLEKRYDQVRVATSTNRKLRSFSSGERKKEFLEFCLSKEPDFLVLDNPFDYLDSRSRIHLVTILEELSEKILFLQLVSRQSDLLPFIQNLKQLNESGDFLKPFEGISKTGRTDFRMPISDLHAGETTTLVDFRGVTVSYGNKKILNDIHWSIRKGEFWQLVGPNGSGKTTLLDTITGENTKGYGQELFIFGRKKGSGESIWEIRKKIGYFSPTMVDLFHRNTSVAEMVLSGFYDSIGLYQKPMDLQRKQATQYLEMAGMESLKNRSFDSLSVGQQRVILILRAIVKQPPLLILDEPTEGMDDQNVALVIQLINLLVHQRQITTLMVSHRSEPGLLPTSIYELIPGQHGSLGKANPI